MTELTTLLPYVRLRFNLEHPTYEECYNFGYECALENINESENPFAEGSNKYEQWAEGWWMGFYEEKSLFEENIADKEVQILTPIITSANQPVFKKHKEAFWLKAFEITGVIAVSAFIGYQVLELVA